MSLKTTLSPQKSEAINITEVDFSANFTQNPSISTQLVPQSSTPFGSPYSGELYFDCAEDLCENTTKPFESNNLVTSEEFEVKEHNLNEFPFVGKEWLEFVDSAMNDTWPSGQKMSNFPSVESSSFGAFEGRLYK